MNIRHVEMRVYVAYTLKVGETKSGVCGVPLIIITCIKLGVEICRTQGSCRFRSRLG